MPIYEYRCSSCRHRMSVFVRTFSPQAAPTCEKCGSPEVQRLVSTFAVARSWGESLDSLPDNAFDGDEGLDDTEGDEEVPDDDE